MYIVNIKIKLFIVPGPVTSLSVETQPTSVTLYWNVPDYVPNRYPIIAYEVGYYTSSDSSCNAIIITDNVVAQGLRNTTATSPTAILDGLVSGTCYVFVVRAYTVIGPGLWTGIVPTLSVTTPTAPPTEGDV